MNSDKADKVLLIDKPVGWTSFDVVKKIRGCLQIKKVGHSGTLDPLASGLLILCTGKKTRELSQYQDLDKEYEGEFTLGSVTPSYDLETPVEIISDCSNISENQVIQTAQTFCGEQEQIPPAFSAVKVDGRRAYHKARKGEEQKINPRKVTIYSFEITDVSIPRVTFKVVCSKGTYIRSLANDFGKELGVGAHLSKLKRTKIGQFRIEDARSIEKTCEDESI